MENICTADTSDIIRNNETGIPDKKLYQSILKTLDKGKNRVFTKREAESIDWLQAKDGVANLKGVGYLRNLKKLDMEGNSLTTLAGVEELSNLESLKVESGRLKSLKGIETLLNLKSLNVIDNKLTNLKGIENLTKLEWLSVGGNKLTNLNEVNKLTNLISIWAVGCNLKKLPDLTEFYKLDTNECDFQDNYLSEKELRNKLPQKFFKSNDDYDKEWVNEQITFQVQNYKVTLTSPTINKITQNTKKITGRTYKNSRIVLYDSTVKTKIRKTITDKKGKFVLSNLNLKKWADKKLVIKISMLCNGKYHPIIKTFTFKVRKKESR